MLNKFSRYQQDFQMHHMYPIRNDGFCACGCGKILSGKQTRWASEKCSNDSYLKFAVIKGSNDVIRELVFERDQGFCRNCGVYDEKWEADHIIPIHQGGGACELENFQTLCPDCHLEKTNFQKNPTDHKFLHRQLLNV